MQAGAFCVELTLGNLDQFCAARAATVFHPHGNCAIAAMPFEYGLEDREAGTTEEMMFLYGWQNVSRIAPLIYWSFVDHLFSCKNDLREQRGVDHVKKRQIVAWADMPSIPVFGDGVVLGAFDAL